MKPEGQNFEMNLRFNHINGEEITVQFRKDMKQINIEGKGMPILDY